MAGIAPPPAAHKPGRKISVAKTGRDAATGEDLSLPQGQLASQLGMLDFSEFDISFNLPPSKTASRAKIVGESARATPPGGPQLLGQRPAKFASRPKKKPVESSSESSDSSSSDDSSGSDSSSSDDSDSDSSSSSDSDDSSSSEDEKKRVATKTQQTRKPAATKSLPKQQQQQQQAASAASFYPSFSMVPTPIVGIPVVSASPNVPEGIPALPASASADESSTSSAENSKVDNGDTALPPRPKAAPPKKENEVSMRIDVLPHMHKGTPFLKYGKQGYPHFRQFQLSEDNLRLMWYSKQKSLKQSQVRLTDVDAIVLGQTTENFERHRAPELARSSFSLYYRSRRETLDLIAKDPNEFKIWTQGLIEIHGMLKKGRAPEVRALKELPLTIVVVKGRRSTVDLFDYDTKECADDGRGPAVSRVNGTGNKQMYKEVAKSFQDLKKRLQKKRSQLQEPRYLHCEPATLASMQHVITKVQASVERIQDWFQNGEYPACDDEIWRATVDLDSLTQMMAAVKSF